MWVLNLKVYVSVDAEGLPGIGSIHHLVPKGVLYDEGRTIFTKFVKEVSLKLLSLGVKDVLIADSHGSMINVKYLDVPEGVKLLHGYPRIYSMVYGVGNYDAAMFVGYHAPAGGSAGGFLAHTYSGATIQRVKVNGVPVSEFYLNALVAGKYGVPVVLVAGDEVLRGDVQRVSKDIVFVSLKSGVGRYAAISKDFNTAVKDLLAGVEESIVRFKEGRIKPLKLTSPATVDIEVKNAGVADMAETIKGVVRIDEYTLRVVTEDPEEIMKVVEAVAWLGTALQQLTSV